MRRETMVVGKSLGLNQRQARIWLGQKPLGMGGRMEAISQMKKRINPQPKQ